MTKFNIGDLISYVQPEDQLLQTPSYKRYCVIKYIEGNWLYGNWFCSKDEAVKDKNFKQDHRQYGFMPSDQVTLEQKYVNKQSNIPIWF